MCVHKPALSDAPRRALSRDSGDRGGGSDPAAARCGPVPPPRSPAPATARRPCAPAGRPAAARSAPGRPARPAGPPPRPPSAASAPAGRRATNCAGSDAAAPAPTRAPSRRVAPCRPSLQPGDASRGTAHWPPPAASWFSPAASRSAAGATRRAAGPAARPAPRPRRGPWPGSPPDQPVGRSADPRSAPRAAGHG